MRELICKLLTKGKHYFRLKHYRYRCVYCKELRMHLIQKEKPPIIPKTNPLESSTPPVNLEMKP